MKNIGMKDADAAAPEVDTGLLTGWLDRTDLARELTLSVDTLQRWETRRFGFTPTRATIEEVRTAHDLRGSKD